MNEIDQLFSQPIADELFSAPPAAPIAPLAPPVKAVPPGREIGDVAATRKNIYDNVLNTFSSMGPVDLPGGYKFEMSDLNYTDPEVFPIARQKQAILRNETLGRRLHGKMRLVDPTGKVIDERSTIMARVPFMTDRGNFIIGGVHHSLGNQMRLMPGVFTRRKANDEVESHINVLPGKGISHRIDLEPETSRIFVKFGNARTPVVPFLKILGASEDSIRQTLGDKLYEANAHENLRPDAFNKLYDKVVRTKPGEQVTDKHARLKQEIEKFELDPQVTRKTLGQPFTHSGAPTVLAAVKRVIDVHNGGEPDARDAAYYQQYLGPEDFIQEKAARVAQHLKPLLRRAIYKNSLAPVQSGAMTRLLESAITGTGLGVPGEEPNPADDLDLRTKITRMGEGGLPSSDSVPMESRMVQPTSFGFIDPVRTAESGNVGVDVRLSSGLRKGKDGKIYAPFRTPDSSEPQWLTPQDVADKVIALPGEMDRPGEFVRVVQDGKFRYEDRSKVELLAPSMEDSVNHLLNMIPAKQNSYPHRLAMGARMMAQALPLTQNEAPYVQVKVPHFGTRTYSEEYGKHFGAISADEPGTVEKVTPDGITVRLNSGERKNYDLYSNFPLNRKSYFNSTPTVKPGDTVRRGDLLARSNFTDDKGTVALGKNLYTAYIPAHDNFEDAYTISESAAKKMTAEMMYQKSFDYEPSDYRSKRSYVSLFPSHYSREQLDRLDDDGVVQVGQTVQYGDPITLAARPAERTADRLVNAKSKSYSDRTDTWDHHYPGVVTDVEKTKNGVLVAIKASKPVEEGDKLSGSYGDKGTIRIVPDNEMPTDSQGRTFDLVANPLGVITRGNSSQIIEAILGKVAEKTGQPYRLRDFEGGKDMVEWARQEAARHGVPDTEDIIDPKTGRKIPNVFTGNRYMYRLHHLADAKASGRGIGGGYTAEGVPSKSSTDDNDGAKRLSNQDIYALMAHGAYGALRDKLYRGQSHPEFWSAWMSGRALPDIRVPEQTTKFFNELRAAGIKPVRESGGRIKIMAMTDKDVDELSQGRTIENAETVDARSAMKPLKGGLFDPSITGGHRGKLFAKMDLAEPYPNPVMEEPIRRVLGLTEKKFQDILAGKETFGDATGPKAIGKALQNLDLDAQIKMARDKVKSSRGAGRDDAARKLRYLQSAKQQDLHPKDWIISKVPVLPPAYRPVGTSDFGKDQMVVADMNYLYRDLWEANQNLKHMSQVIADPGDEHLAVYKALQAVTGLGDPVNPANAEKSVKGVLAQIFGSTSKYGKVQRKLLSTPVDMVGRGVVVPDSDMDMDQIGIPEDKAWNVYSPFIVRRMVMKGTSPAEASRAVQDRTKTAREAMLEEMEVRPVQVSRSPVLHKYGHMAFRPKLVSGNAIKTNPTIAKGFNLDHDGNCVDYDTDVVLILDKSIFTSEKEFLDIWDNFITQSTGQSLSAAVESGRELRIKIGEFPRTGSPVTTSRHQKVYPVPVGVNISSYDHINGIPVVTPITGFTVDEGHDCVEVTTSRGRKVIVSNNESMCVFDLETGLLKKAEPAVGQIVPYVKKDFIHGTKYDFDLGWWYGVLIADGWISNDRTVGYSKCDSERRDRFVELARRYFGNTFNLCEYEETAADRPGKFADSVKVHLNGVELVRRVFRITDESHDASSGDRGALYKRIPDELLYGGSRECLLGLLSGLLDGDSGLSWNYAKPKRQFVCKFNTSSKSLVTSIQALLRKLGVRSSLSVIPARKTSKESYALYPSLVDMLGVLKECVLYGPEEKKRVGEFLEEYGAKDYLADRLDIVPISSEVAGKVSSVLLESNQSSMSATLIKKSKSGYLGREAARRLVDFVDNDLNDDQWSVFVSTVNGTDIHWEEVVEVSPVSKRDVFDFEIPSTKVYTLANGLVIYDTMNFHVPFSPDAVKDAYEKMLPSRNLYSVSGDKMHQMPSNEFISGLYLASSRVDSKRQPVYFKTKKEALQAYEAGEISTETPVVILQN